MLRPSVATRVCLPFRVASTALSCAAVMLIAGCLHGRSDSHRVAGTAVVEAGVAPLPSTSPTTSTVRILTLRSERSTLTLADPSSSPRWYYGQRFDGGTMTPNFHFDGIDVFGPADLTIRANAAAHDSAARGVAGEFDIEGPATYAEASPRGGSFVKIGVGELRRTSPDAYKFYVSYDVVRAPTWRTTTHADGSVTIVQSLDSSIGIAYELSRTYQLTSDAPGFTVTTTLSNTGTRTIDSEHYLHTFFTTQQSPRVAPGDAVRWSFPTTGPVHVRTPPGTASAQESELRFATTMPARGSVYAPLPIDSPAPGGQAVTVRRGEVEMTLSSGIAIHRAAVWSNEQYTCPELFARIVVEPYNETTWTSLYTFRRLDATTQPTRIGCATTYR